MITTGLAATNRNAIILSEINMQEFTAKWDRAALAQEGDFITEDGKIITRAHLERTLARAELTLELLRAALEPEPAAPSTGLANLCAGLDLPQSAAGLDALAELDPSDPLAVQVARLTERLATLEALLLAQVTAEAADRAHYQAEGTPEVMARAAESDQAQRAYRRLATAYQEAHTR